MADPFLQDAVRWQPYCVFDPLGFETAAALNARAKPRDYARAEFYLIESVLGFPNRL
jgi:hypothetical protein